MNLFMSPSRIDVILANSKWYNSIKSGKEYSFLFQIYQFCKKYMEEFWHLKIHHKQKNKKLYILHLNLIIQILF